MQVTQILFKSAAIEIGKSCFRILKLFICWIALSTCILCLVILLVFILSSSENCGWSPRKGGMFNKAPGSKSSSISKPQLAIISSPGSNNFMMPQSFVNCLSDVLPAYSSETKVKSPLGEMPIKHLPVLWFL